MQKFLLVILIRMYRSLPSRLKKPCPREVSCSARGLAAAQAGLGIAGVLAVVSSCDVCFDPDT